MNKGKILIISAPSGAGKTTIVKSLLREFPQLAFSVSACSRPIRKNETDGKDYYFLTPEKFREKIRNDEFLEWEEVYPGSFYGTLKSELSKIWSMGQHAVFDVDVKGGMNIKKQFPRESLAVFIKPPDMETLRQRLINRGTENPESLEKRLKKAEYEMSFESGFDVSVVNDNLDRAKDEACSIVKNFLMTG